MTDLSLLQDFLTETSEHLEEMERNLLLLENDAHDKELLNDIFRSIHTIKGSSDYLGMARIAELSHRLENLLDLMRQEKRAADQETVDLLIDGRDRIAILIADLEETQTETTEIDDLLARLDATVTQEVDTGALATEPASPEVGHTDNADAAREELSAIENESDEELLAIFLDQFEAGLKGLRDSIGGASILTTDLIDAALKQLASMTSSANYMGYNSLCRLYEPWEAELRGLSAQTAANNERGMCIQAYWQNYLKPHLVTLLALIPARARDLSSYLEDPSFDALPKEAPASAAAGDGDAEEQLFSDVCLDELLDDPACQEAPAAAASSTPETSSEEPELAFELEEDLLLPDPEASAPEAPAADPTEDNPPAIEAAAVNPVDRELLADFIEEAQEHVEEMESRLLALEQAPEDADILNDIFRCVHTIKGSADYIGLIGIAELSHELESFLDHLRQGHRAVDAEVLETLMAAGDHVRDMIAAQAEEGLTLPASEDMLLRLKAACDPTVPEPQPDEAPVSEASGAGQTIAAPVNYIEENDKELLDIFLQQLKAQLSELIRCAGEEAFLSSAVLEQCRRQLAELHSSANYMGYAELQQTYTDWEHHLDEQMEAIGIGATVEGPAWLSTSVLPFVKSIAAFFPQAEALPSLWEHLDIPAPADTLPQSEVPTTPPENTDILAQLGSAFDAMLQGGPASAAHIPEGIEGELFSAAEDGATDAETAHPSAIDTVAGGTLTDAIGDAGDSEAGAEPSPTEPGGVAADKVTTAATGDDAPAEADAQSPASDKPSPSAAPVEAPAAAAPAPEAAKPGAAAKRMLRQSIRVDAGKIDALMNQVGELVVSRAFFSQLCNEMRELQHYLKQAKRLDKREFKQVSGLTFRISEATVALGRVANELQEGVMRVRMLPIAQLFNRYPRLVHDLARSSGKKVTLEVRGEDTELDKMVIERIADPLVHIIRNAVDHGLETTEERRRKGKPETGVLALNAFHESNHVVIEIEDDGGGVDFDRIKAKAIDKGLIGESAASQLSEREIINLILIPGFSTAETITHTSGRGVGMDVVKKNIEKLNGTLEVDTIPGQSTRIRIKIPLTLAIIPALLVKVMNEMFTIPLSVVDETLRVFKDEISVIEGVDVMYLRDETIPLIRLRDVFSMDTRSEIAEKFFVVIVNTGQKRVGLIVDNMLGQEEVVIKPLEDYLQENSGFSGATILGDGQISLILDVYELIKLSTNKQARRQIVDMPL